MCRHCSNAGIRKEEGGSGLQSLSLEGALTEGEFTFDQKMT